MKNVKVPIKVALSLSSNDHNTVTTDTDLESMTDYESDSNNVGDDESCIIANQVQVAIELQMTIIDDALVRMDNLHENKDINSIVQIMEEHPSVISIQEMGCEMLVDLMSEKRDIPFELTYKDSQHIHNVVIDTIANHQDVSNIQRFGYDVIKRIAMIEGKEDDKKVSNEKTSCMSRVCSVFSCRRNWTIQLQ